MVIINRNETSFAWRVAQLLPRLLTGCAGRLRGVCRIGLYAVSQGGRVMRGGKPACATRLCWGELQIFMPAVHSPVTQTNKEQRIVGRIWRNSSAKGNIRNNETLYSNYAAVTSDLVAGVANLVLLYFLLLRWSSCLPVSFHFHVSAAAVSARWQGDVH